MKTLLLAMLLPFAAQAQLAIYAVNGITETAVGSTYNLGPVALNSTVAVNFRIYNVGPTPIQVPLATLGGTGFTFTVSPVLPYTLVAFSTTAQTLNVTVRFTPTTTSNYSASLQVGSISVILLGSGTTAPTLMSVAGCSSSFNFGSITLGSSAICTLSLQNLNPQAITVNNVNVNGLGFSGPAGISTPLILQAGQSASLAVTFTPTSPISYTGTLSVGAQTYGLSGVGLLPRVPTPVLQFDSGAAASGQQRLLTMTIPGGSPAAINGYVNILFTSATPIVKDDSLIMFLANGTRTLPFSVGVGETKVLLGGLASAFFQTGTTEGTIAFTITSAAAFVGDPTTKMFIPGTMVILDPAFNASKQRYGFLDISLTGVDNTYSIGVMSFSFFDSSGNVIASTNADFTGAFRNYYAGQIAGSAFKVIVSFPVNGSTDGIASVAVTMTNLAGIANTGKIVIQ